MLRVTYSGTAALHTSKSSSLRLPDGRFVAGSFRTSWVMCEIGHTRWPANTDRFEAGSETQHAPIDRRASRGGGLVAAVFRPPLNLVVYSIALKGCRIVAEGPSHAAVNASEIETQCDRLRHNVGSGGFGISERRRAPQLQDHLWRSGCLRQSDHRDHP